MMRMACFCFFSNFFQISGICTSVNINAIGDIGMEHRLVQYNVFVPSVFWKNSPTAEFGMISAETACRAIERK